MMLFKLFFALLASTAPQGAEEIPVVPAVIIGGGVGGDTAAIYLARAGWQPHVIEGARSGGAIAASDAVENWPGALKIRGSDLMDNIRGQAEKNGTIFHSEEVVAVDFHSRPFAITVRSLDHPELKTIRAYSCIIATGSSPNFLNVPGEREYWGKGLSGCAICDGSLYRGKTVGIVGGGDAALSDALYLSKIAQEVKLFVRKEAFKAIDEKRKAELLALSNVKVFFQTKVNEINGDGQKISHVVIQHGKKTEEIPLSGLFLAIGSRPNTALFKNQLELDANGYIVLKKGQQTSVDGVYAVGDVADPFYKQAISAAGDGAKAALDIIHQGLSWKIFQQKPTVAQDKPHSVIEVTSREQFDREIRTGDLPVVVDFYASWCPPCKRIAPHFEARAAELQGKVKFLKVNVDNFNDLSSNYRIQAMPTVIYLNPEGKIIDRKVGENEIKDLLLQLSPE